MVPRKHKHADLIRQWIDDDSLVVQYQYRPDFWLDISSPEWNESTEYRFKPKTIRIGAVDVLEPCRVTPSDGTKYWIPSITRECLIDDETWDGSSFDERVLSRGLLHLTREGATQHAKALLSLSS